MAVEELRARIVSKLTADESAERERLISIALDHVLSQPISRMANPDEVTDIIVATTTHDNASRAIELQVKPAWDRYKARWKETNESLGEWIDEDGRARIENIVVNARLPKGEWAKNAVDPSLVKELLSPILQDTLLSFAKKLPIPGLGGGDESSASSSGSSRSSGLGGFGKRLLNDVGKRASKLADAGKGVLGGLGAEVERQMQKTAKEFADSAQSEMHGALMRRLRSDEGKKIVAEIRKQVLDCVLRTPLTEIDEDNARLPWDDIFGVAPAIVQHVGTLEAFRALVTAEVHAIMEIEGHRTVREFLEETQSIDHVLKPLMAKVDELATDFFAGEPFGSWLDDLLAE